MFAFDFSYLTTKTRQVLLIQVCVCVCVLEYSMKRKEIYEIFDKSKSKGAPFAIIAPYLFGYLVSAHYTRHVKTK